MASSVGGAVTGLSTCFGVESWYTLVGTRHRKRIIVPLHPLLQPSRVPVAVPHPHRWSLVREEAVGEVGL